MKNIKEVFVIARDNQYFNAMDGKMDYNDEVLTEHGCFLDNTKAQFKCDRLNSKETDSSRPGKLAEVYYVVPLEIKY